MPVRCTQQALRIAVDSDRYPSYGCCAIRTPYTVTMTRQFNSSRTAADSQPLPRHSGFSADELRHLGLRDSDRLVRWLNESKGTSAHERVVLMRKEIEILRSEFVAHSEAYKH